MLDLVDNLHELQAHLDKILKLCNKDFSGLDLEKLACNVNIYSMRLNKSDRLLYTLVKDKIFILELILNHDYQKSRFLNNPKLLKYLLNYLKLHASDIPDNIEFELTFSKVHEPSNPLSNASPEKTLELIPVMKHDKKLIQFNSTQNQALMTNGELVVIGRSGSGKTCVLESKLKCFFSEIRLQQRPDDSIILFTTESEGLLSFQHHQLKEEPNLSPILDQHSQFSTFKTVIKPILTQNQLSPIDCEFEFFKSWFEKKHQQFPYTSSFVWRELRNASGYDKNHYVHEIGNKNTQVTEQNMRVEFYSILDNYLLYLKQSKLFSLNLQKLPTNLRPIYDMILVDEAQDLSTAQLKNLKQLAKNNHIVYFLGEHQIIYDSISKFHFLENLFFLEHHSPLPLLQLPSCYRNPQPILRIINKLIEIKCFLTGGLLDKYESPVLELAPDHLVCAGDVQWITPDDMTLKQSILPYIDNPHFAVIVDTEQDVAEALEFFACPPEQIFTKASCKGFQFKYVLLWKPLQSYQLRQCDKKIAELESSSLDEAKVFHRAKNKSHDDETLIVFNQLITSFGRSTELIIMVEHKKFHPHQNLIDCLIPLFNLNPMTIEPAACSIEDWVALGINFLKEQRKKEAQAIYQRHLTLLYPDFISFCNHHGFYEPKALDVVQEEQKNNLEAIVEERAPILNYEFEEPLFNSKTKKDRLSLKSVISTLMESTNLSQDLLKFFNLFRSGRSLHVALFDKLITDYSLDGKRGRKQKKTICLLDWLLRKEQRADVLYAFASYPQVLMKFPFKDCIEYLHSNPDMNEPLDAFDEFISIQYFLYDAYRKKEISASLLFCPDSAPPLAFLLVQFQLSDLLPSLITKGIDLSFLTPNGDSIIHAAFKTGQYDVLNFFEKLELDLNLPDSKGWSIGHYVAQAGDFQAFKSLSQLPISWFDEHHSPMHLAIQNNQYQFIEQVHQIRPIGSETIARCDLLGMAFVLNKIEVIQTFLKIGIDFCKLDSIYKVPYFYLAVNSYNTVLLEQFFQHGINFESTNPLKQNLVHYAVLKHAITVLDWLWENPSLKPLFKSPDHFDFLPIHSCAFDKELNLLTWFKQKGSDSGFDTKNFIKLAKQAIKNNNQPLLLRLIEEGLNIKECNELGANLLHFAVQHKSLDMVNFLLSQKVSVLERDNRQRCPIIIAAEVGDLSILKQLAKQVDHLNQQDIEGNNIAHLAVLFSNNNIIEYLLSMPSTRELFFQNNLHNQNPIEQSIILDRIDFLKLFSSSKLIDFRVRMANGEYPIQIAIKYASQKFIKNALKFGINVSIPNYVPGGLLFNALQHQNNEIFMILLHLGAPYLLRDANDRTLTEVAASHGNITILDILFNLSEIKFEEFNYLFNIRMDLIIKEAIINNKYQVIEWIAKNRKLNPLFLQFHEAKSFINLSHYFGAEQIIETAKLGHCETLAALYKHGINIFKTDAKGQDIIQIALQQQNIKVLSLCKRLGYEFGVMNFDGKFPIICAAESGCSLVIDFLILCEVNCNVRRTKDKATPILIAAENGYLDAFKTLIDVSDLKAINCNGENLLHLAVLNHCPQIFDTFMECEAFTDLLQSPDKMMGYTPLELIAIQNNTEIAKLLLSKGVSFELSKKLKLLIGDISPEIKQLFSKKMLHPLGIFKDSNELSQQSSLNSRP